MLAIKRKLKYKDKKALESAMKNILKGLAIIEQLGYSSYMSPNGWHIMDGDTHTDDVFCKHIDENVVAEFRITNVTAGDW